ncbi:fungal hydrophobin [Obba rivulosa]|uniref:Hydrophobin n=1 Tax=Obba rivulosa TaxID=1052685 RepID=A0A8E2DHB2_9APHY|nr:fungal hydrophobin [Obba rivulosa]
MAARTHALPLLALLLALVLAALAHPAPPAVRAKFEYPRPYATRQDSQCNSGSLQCCDSVSTPGNSSVVRRAVRELGVRVAYNQPVGVGCSSIDPINVGGGTSCSSDPVCCEDNSFGLIGIGCTPISIGL